MATVTAKTDARRDMEKQLAAAAALKGQLRDILGDDLDGKTLLDSVEGETDLLETMSRIIEQIGEDEARTKGIKDYEERVKGRRMRIERRIESLRTMMANALDTIGRRKFELDAATVTLKDVPPKLVVTDEAAIPAGFWKTPDPVLDKSKLTAELRERAAKIKDAIDAVEAGTMTVDDANIIIGGLPAIPGADLGNGAITVQVRFQ